jgi:hypothetical protein
MCSSLAARVSRLFLHTHKNVALARVGFVGWMVTGPHSARLSLRCPSARIRLPQKSANSRHIRQISHRARAAFLAYPLTLLGGAYVYESRTRTRLSPQSRSAAAERLT